ncbi:hypothetical protein GIB67_039492 [Kingdonia uniflora]|uniref:DDE Tnp4 domain-containing protein n=1 Tax=Kingdonia uniflora TaxID=39325 RepID=A0A7J7LJ20_9MAGN|nr:hypothetical protein GIB67_039492 [Kingdonia uniflora]
MYYLCDPACVHTKYFMSPFRGVGYWLQDFQRGGRPKIIEEHFNPAHAKFRNAIERTFGVLKARFPMLKEILKYSS